MQSLIIVLKKPGLWFNIPFCNKWDHGVF